MRTALWRGIALLFGVLVIGFAPRAAHAGGFEIADQAASASGTGGAGTARANDASAAWFNPAALADGGGLRLAAGVTLLAPSLHADASDGTWKSDSDIGVSPAPHVYVSVAASSWAVGISINAPFASRVRWPANWTQRFEILESRPQFIRFAPFVAWSFGPVRIAAGPHFDVGSLEIRRGLDFVDDEGSAHIDLSGFGIGADAAVFVDLTDMLALGLTYKSRTTVSLDGEVDFETPTAFESTAPDQNASSEMTLPDRLSLGAALTLGDLRALLDLGLTLWSVNDELVIDFENSATPDRVQINDWHTTFSMRGGAEYTLFDLWTLRAGAFYDMTPIPTKTLAPSAPDSNRVGVTVGTGLLWNGLSLDVSYGLTILTGATSESADAPPATYDGLIHAVGLTAAYRM